MKLQKSCVLVLGLLLGAGLIGCADKPGPAVDEEKPVAGQPEPTGKEPKPATVDEDTATESTAARSTATSAKFEAKRKDLAAADLAAHLSVNWQAFTCSFDEPPTEFGVDLLVTNAGKTEIVRGPGCTNAKQRTYDVAFLFEATPDGSALRYTLRFSGDGLGAGQHARIKNPFVGLQMRTIAAPVRFDDQGRTVVAFALPPGESRVTTASRHPDTAYRSLALRVRATTPQP